MSRVSDEARSWAPADEGEEVIVELRSQLEAVRARLEEHRAVMNAAGLAAPPGKDDEAAG